MSTDFTCAALSSANCYSRVYKAFLTFQLLVLGIILDVRHVEARACLCRRPYAYGASVYAYECHRLSRNVAAQLQRAAKTRTRCQRREVPRLQVKTLICGLTWLSLFPSRSTFKSSLRQQMRTQTFRRPWLPPVFSLRVSPRPSQSRTFASTLRRMAETLPMPKSSRIAELAMSATKRPRMRRRL